MITDKSLISCRLSQYHMTLSTRLVICGVTARVRRSPEQRKKVCFCGAFAAGESTLVGSKNQTKKHIF